MILLQRIQLEPCRRVIGENGPVRQIGSVKIELSRKGSIAVLEFSGLALPSNARRCS
jgi:hypothetical protein